MATATQKEITLSLPQLLALATALVLPGLGAFYSIRERVVLLETNQATQTLQANRLAEKLEDIQENITLVRIQLARAIPEPAPKP